MLKKLLITGLFCVSGLSQAAPQQVFATDWGTTTVLPTVPTAAATMNAYLPTVVNSLSQLAPGVTATLSVTSSSSATPDARQGVSLTQWQGSEAPAYGYDGVQFNPGIGKRTRLTLTLSGLPNHNALGVKFNVLANDFRSAVNSGATCPPNQLKLTVDGGVKMANRFVTHQVGGATYGCYAQSMNDKALIATRQQIPTFRIVTNQGASGLADMMYNFDLYTNPFVSNAHNASTATIIFDFDTSVPTVGAYWSTFLFDNLSVWINTVPLTDTDADGIPDTTDNCTIVANPLQTDADADGYGNRCDGDVDQNGIVEDFDLDNHPYIATLGTNMSGYEKYDFNEDGVLNSADWDDYMWNTAATGFYYSGVPGPSALHP